MVAPSKVGRTGSGCTVGPYCCVASGYFWSLFIPQHDTLHTAQNRPFFGLIIYAKYKMLYCNDLYCDGGGGELKKKKNTKLSPGGIRPSVCRHRTEEKGQNSSQNWKGEKRRDHNR